MKRYLNKMISLEEKALAQVAINLCQENGFKEIALNLEKPTYGGFIYNVLYYEPTFFVSDPETLSIWAKVKEDKRLCKAFQKSRRDEGEEHLKQWHAAVEVQCERLTMHLPDRFKRKIRPWINRIALEYLTYVRRQEVFFEVSRYYLMNTLTAEDWDGEGQVDEEKVARRLLEDERLTVLQRYKIACVYCLEEQVLPLWNRLTRVDKEFFVKDVDADAFGDCHNLVFLWSRFMDGTVGEHQLWNSALFEAIHSGNYSALMVCWEKLKNYIPQLTVIDRATECVDHLLRWEENRHWKQSLVSPLVPGTPKYIEHSTLPSYYCKLLVFFLLQMDQEQQLDFFTYAFEVYPGESVTKFLLDWPYQDDFLPTMNRLWGIMPHEEYNQCLLALVAKYSRNEGKTNGNYDCRSLLGALWEETPEEYKNYVLRKIEISYEVAYENRTVLSLLLEKSPFEEEDQRLFTQIFRDQPLERRQGAMFFHFYERGFMCSRLIMEGKWSFLNWFVKECIPQEGIAVFKKSFIQSRYGMKLCLDAFEANRLKLVEDLFDWSFDSVVEKTKHKVDFLNDKMCFSSCASLLRSGKFAEVDRIFDFFSPSVEERERYKLHFAQKACDVLLQDYTNDSWVEDIVLEQMDRIIAWSIDAEEETREFKTDLLSRKGIKTHYTIVFTRRVWEKAERFYQWFDLSSEEIKQLKWDTLWCKKAIAIYGSKGLLSLLPSLSWCLADEKMVMDFKTAFGKKYSTVLEEREQLDELVSKLLGGFRKVPNKTNRKGVSVRYGKGKRGRSSVAVEDKPYSLRKRPK